MSRRRCDTHPFGLVVNIFAAALGNVGYATGAADVVSDAIGIETRFRASINLGVYDKVHRALSDSRGGGDGRAGTGYKRVSSCRVTG